MNTNRDMQMHSHHVSSSTFGEVDQNSKDIYQEQKQSVQQREQNRGWP